MDPRPCNFFKIFGRTAKRNDGEDGDEDDFHSHCGLEFCSHPTTITHPSSLVHGCR